MTLEQYNIIKDLVNNCEVFVYEACEFVGIKIETYYRYRKRYQCIKY